jgi:alpha-N-arabinofuranosidase
VYNLEDALVCAQYMGSFIRHADVVKMAAIAQIVNVIAPVLTRSDGILVQSIYHPMHLYSKYARGISLCAAVTADTYRAGDRGDVSVVDVSASYDAAKSEIAIFVVNRNPAESVSVTINVADKKIENILGVDQLGGGDVKAANTWENQEIVKPYPGKATIVDGGVHVTIPAPGLAVVRVSVSKL